jgi:hypothetical protein
MKRVSLILLQIFAGCFLWFWAVVFWKHWLPFYTDYGDVSRIEAKGVSIAVILFLLSHYTTYSLRRLLSREA